MPTLDARIDAYIEKAAPFAQPILQHVRALVHKACPDVQETVKWGFPHFEYKGLLCSMAAFKEHCAMGFWKADAMKESMAAHLSTDAMGHFGRITSVKDLPSNKIMHALIREAMALNEQGVKAARPSRAKKEAAPPPGMPDDVAAALDRHPDVRANFEAFSPGKRKDYLVWITEAKTAATREKRIATMLEWVAENKSRNWKYEKC